MIHAPWQLKTPLDAICLDCDGTLSRIEGIDVLAEMNGVGEEVAAMTAQAMSTCGINPALYRDRLECVRPTRNQVDQLAQAYYKECGDDAAAVIATLLRLAKPVFVLSAGVNPAVRDFVAHFNIDARHVYAVDLSFDAEGHYRDFDHASPMTRPGGKQEVITRIQKQHPRVLHIGDGVNDFEVREHVTRFVGYGGAYPRENLAALCEFYLRAPTLAPLLALSLTAQEVSQLKADERDVYNKGCALLEEKDVRYND